MRVGFSIAIALVILAGVLWFRCADAADEYDRRAHFGGWLDFDGDGLDAREEMLAASIVPGLGWLTPYRGKIAVDVRLVEVDHIVPLRWAWDHGADQWDQARRQEFANDPANLVVVTRSANRSKGASGPRKWMPSNLAIWQAYLGWWDKVLEKYGLAYTARETRAVECLRRRAAEHEIGVKVRRIRRC